VDHRPQSCSISPMIPNLFMPKYKRVSKVLWVFFLSFFLSSSTTTTQDYRAIYKLSRKKSNATISRVLHLAYYSGHPSLPTCNSSNTSTTSTIIAMEQASGSQSRPPAQSQPPAPSRRPQKVEEELSPYDWCNGVNIKFKSCGHTDMYIQRCRKCAAGNSEPCK